MVQVKKIEKRNAILKSAYRLFRRKGYISTTTAEIAVGAKVSESNLYLYFNSKFDILYNLFEPWIQKRIQNLEIEMANEPRPRARLRILLTALWKDIPRDDNGFNNNMMQAVSTLGRRDKYNPKLLKWVEKKVEDMILNTVSSKRRTVLSKGDLARVLVLAQDGFVMQAHLDGPADCSDQTIELFCDLILGESGCQSRITRVP
jgi:AcrR family transcriptional regulator